ncbi:Curli production assembly/transport component CsgG [Paucihalobacter ruber]|nr:Curli production assembly/transport component CsgG [Paucihalobacter ruber]
MRNSKLKIFLSIVCLLFLAFGMYSQSLDQEAYKTFKKASLLDMRGTNIIDIGVGSAVPNNDFPNPQFEIYFRGGYKRYITPHIYLGLDYHKFNLANKDLPNNGFMSFDLNAHIFLTPYKRFSPYVFFGSGLTASNYFEQTSQKVQAGAGIEVMVVDFIGLTLSSDYNYQFDDTLDGLEFGDSNDTFFRMSFGVNFYFGGARKKAKLMKNLPTVINSNRIDG